MTWTKLQVQNQNSNYTYVKISQIGLKYFQREHRQLNEVRQSIHDMKIEFNKEIDIPKKTQAKIVMEMKNTLDQIKSSANLSPIG